MTSPAGSPRPLSLRAVRDDDALLDEIAGRRTRHQLAAEPVAVLLSALAAEVDHDLPTGVDHLATGALAAALTAGPGPAESASSVRATSVLPVRPPRPPRPPRPQAARRLVRVRRGTAAMVATAFVLGSAGVAAAVTGSVPAALSVNGIVRLLTGAPDPTPSVTKPPLGQAQARSEQDQTRSELARRLREQARRPSGPDVAELARLLRLAATLPDHGGPDVQALLQQLRARAAAGAEPTGPKVSPARKRPAPASSTPLPQHSAGTPVRPAVTPSRTPRVRTSSARPGSTTEGTNPRVGGRPTSAEPKAGTARR